MTAHTMFCGSLHGGRNTNRGFNLTFFPSIKLPETEDFKSHMLA